MAYVLLWNSSILKKEVHVRYATWDPNTFDIKLVTLEGEFQLPFKSDLEQEFAMCMWHTYFSAPNPQLRAAAMRLMRKEIPTFKVDKAVSTERVVRLIRTEEKETMTEGGEDQLAIDTDDEWQALVKDCEGRSRVQYWFEKLGFTMERF